METKLLVILPKYDSSSPDHLTHLLEMVSLWNKNFDVSLLFENLVVNKIDVTVDSLIFPSICSKWVSLVRRIKYIILSRIGGCEVCFVYYSYWGAIFASIVFRLTGGKVYYWHCERFNNFYSKEQTFVKTISKWLCDKVLLMLALYVVTGLITGSDSVAQSYVEIFKISRDKIHIIPNWVSLKRFKLPKSKLYYKKFLDIPSSKQVILFVHKLVPRKGADFLPEIIKSTIVNNKKVIFIIVGDGQLLKSLTMKIKAMRLSEYVRFEGAIANSQILPYYGCADVFIMPSRQEGFPRVLLECMATGLPFVATDVGGVRDLITDLPSKHLIEPENIDAFSIKIGEILKNRTLNNKLVSYGYRNILRYDIDLINKRFIELFSK